MKMIDRGQTTLELTTALIVVMMLLIGSVKIFMWLNERIVRRQMDYEAQRVDAANAPPQTIALSNKNGVSEGNLKLLGSGETKEELPDESTYPALNIFNKLN